MLPPLAGPGSNDRGRAGSVEMLRSPRGMILARRYSLMPDGGPSVAAAPALTPPTYPITDRVRILAQLRIVLDDYYVHLGIKRSQYGFDPLRAVELLLPHVSELSDAEFHESLVVLVARTRDRHLSFRGPSPTGVVAVLPFLVERCWEADAVHYMVTKLSSGTTPQYLQAGALVTHWNGMPIDRLVRLNANVFDGGNESASIARSVEFLTQRPLGQFAAPMEDWVDLRFEVGGVPREERFTWRGLDLGDVPATPSVGRNVVGFGGDRDLLRSQHAKRVQFAPASFDDSPAPADSAAVEPGVPAIVGSKANFQYGSVMTAHGTFAYVRLFHFGANDADDIARDFITVLPNLPGAGLVLDLRGNPGGYIAAGERVLQLLTPRRIMPTRFQFRVTERAAAMASVAADFAPWRQSFTEAARTGEAFTQGYPIEGTDDDANRLGQYYFGPVVLVTDALAFSTADMFAAGFKDHAIGRVICVDRNTAAAGGNNWTFEVLRLFNPDLLLDPSLQAAFEAGTLNDAVRAALNAQGVSLAAGATLAGPQAEYDGRAWRIDDGAVQLVVRVLPWMNRGLNVYQDQGRLGFASLPAGVSLGFTARRCIRTGPNEGRVLEDLGIEPDIVYRLTVRDVLDRNRDLLTRATQELAGMDGCQFDIDVQPRQGGGQLLSCRTRNVTSIEACFRDRFIGSANPSAGGTCELRLPPDARPVVIKGWNGDQLVARRLIV